MSNLIGKRPMKRIASWALSIFLLIFSFSTLIPSVFAAPSCYVVSNFAAPNYVNITLNGTKFMLRLNYLGPNQAGITINDRNSYSLALGGAPQVILANTNYTYSSALLNVSWKPVEHTAIVNLCSVQNAAASAIANTPVYTNVNWIATTGGPASTAAALSAITIASYNSTNAISPGSSVSGIHSIGMPITLVILAVSIIAVLFALLYSIRNRQKSNYQKK